MKILNLIPVALSFGLIVHSGAETQLPEVQTNTAGIANFLSHERGWRDLEYSNVELSADPFSIFRVYSSRSECGRGVCLRYVFRETSPGRWRLIAFASGNLRPDPPHSAHALYDILVTTSVGVGTGETTTARLKFDGRFHVGLP